MFALPPHYISHRGYRYFLVEWVLKCYVISCLVLSFGLCEKYLKGKEATLSCGVSLSDRERSDSSRLGTGTYSWSKRSGKEFRILTYINGKTHIRESNPLGNRVEFEPPNLRIRNLEVADSGDYICSFLGENLDNRTTTRLEVNAVPTVTSEENRFPTVDKETGFYTAATCRAVGGKPPARVKWIYTDTGKVQMSNESLDTLDDGSFTVTSKLLLKPGLIGRFLNSTNPVTENDWRKNFACVVEHDHFSEDVEQTVAIDLLYSPIVTISMESNKLTCEAFGNPAPLISWTRPDGSMVKSTRHIYIDQSRPTASSGRYVCLAKSNIGPPGVATLNVQKSRDLPSLFTTTLRYNASLPVNAQGYAIECIAELEAVENLKIENVRFNWTKDHIQIEEQLSSYLMERNVTILSEEKWLVRSTLRMIRVQRYRDEGLFECSLLPAEIGSGYVRAVLRSTHVKIDYPPMKGSIVVVAHPRGTVREHTDVVLTCDATSSPKSSYRWFFNGTDKSAGRRLVLKNISRNEAGIYKCVAFNYVPGSAFKEVKLVVKFPPGNVVITRETYGLSCNAEGGAFPPPVYTWLLPNGTLTDGNKLAIPSFDVSSSLAYTCLVGNGLQKTSNATFHIKAMQTAGIGSLTIGEFVVTVIVALLLLIILIIAAVWLLRKREWGRKSVVTKAKKDTKLSNLLEYSEHLFGGSLASMSAPCNVFDDGSTSAATRLNGCGGTHRENGSNGNAKYDASKQMSNGKSNVRSPKTDGKPALVNFATINSKSNLAANKHGDNKGAPSRYRSVEALDGSGVEILENPSLNATTKSKDLDAPKPVGNVLPNSPLRLTTFSQPQTSFPDRPILTNYYTTRNPAKNKAKEHSLHRAMSETFRSGHFGEVSKITRKFSKDADTTNTTSAGTDESSPPPQYSKIAEGRAMSPRPNMSTPIQPDPSFVNLKSDSQDNGYSSDSNAAHSKRRGSFDRQPGSSVSQIGSNRYPSFRHNHVTHPDPYERYPASSPVPSRCQSVEPYNLACTPPMADLPIRNYMYQPYADPRIGLSIHPPKAALHAGPTTMASPYDSGSDSAKSSNATTVTSSGRRMQSLTLV